MKKIVFNFLLTFSFFFPFVACSNDNDIEEVNEIKIEIPEDDIINPSSDYLVVIGDIQTYTLSDDLLQYLNYSLDWVYFQNKYYNNIKFVLQNGDLTETNTEDQWSMAKDAFTHLNDSVPYIWCTGNHDYTWGGETLNKITDRSSNLLSEYGNNPLLENSIIYRFEADKLDNVIIENYINEKRFDIISLEFGPRPEAVEWASAHVKRNPGINYILMTHEFLTGNGEMVADAKSYARNQFDGIPCSTPKYVWNNLVTDNDNIVCIICGHNGFCKYLEKENDFGRNVPIVLFNLQYRENGGNSMIQLWEFPKDENRVNISVYNTMSRELYKPEETSFSFSYR